MADEFDTDNEVDAPVIGPSSVRPRTWVLVRDGVVHSVKHTLDWFKHPFGADHGGRVVDGTGVEVAPGYFVDAKGNFTPAEGRVGRIPEGLPAYHAGPGVPAMNPGALAASLAGNAEVPETQNTAPVDPAAGLAMVTPTNKDMAQHDDGSEPVHTTDVVAPAAPTDVEDGEEKHEEEHHEEPHGFAAMDEKAHD